MLRAWLVMVHNLCINVHIWLVGGGGGGGGRRGACLFQS